MTQAAPSQHTHHCSLTMPRVSSPPEWNLTSLLRLSKTSLHPRIRSISHRIYKNMPPRPHNKKNLLPWVSTELAGTGDSPGGSRTITWGACKVNSVPQTKRLGLTTRGGDS